NGDEVLRLIRSKADTRDIPVVMISADTDTEKISKCIELGADDYLPFASSIPNSLTWLSRERRSQKFSRSVWSAAYSTSEAFRRRHGLPSDCDGTASLKVLSSITMGRS